VEEEEAGEEAGEAVYQIAGLYQVHWMNHSLLFYTHVFHLVHWDNSVHRAWDIV
jgi:hypothetical protein